MAGSVPCIYSGQEEPVLRALAFFEKDPISFGKFARTGFYKTLLELRKKDVALAADASFKKVNVKNDKALYAYVREKDGKKIFIILNLSGSEQAISVTDKDLLGKPYNVFMGTNEEITSKQWMIEPWGYVVYEYN